MTLLDAPRFDEARYRRHRLIGYSAGGLLLVFVRGLVAGGGTARGFSLELEQPSVGTYRLPTDF